MSISANAFSRNRELDLFLAFPSAGQDADTMSGSAAAFLGHELLVGTKALYKKTDRSAQVSWHFVKQNCMPWLNYQSLNNQEKQCISHLYCCYWSLCIFCLFVYRVSCSPVWLPTCNVEDDLEFLDC